jgi:hypothetical protein
MKTAHTLVQTQSSGEISALARLKNAQLSRCSLTRHNTGAQYNCIDGAHNIETSKFQHNSRQREDPLRCYSTAAELRWRKCCIQQTPQHCAQVNRTERSDWPMRQ